jgi:hypothetical protein
MSDNGGDPGKRVRVSLPGGEVGDGTEVQALRSNEPWAEFILDDGAVIKVRTLLVSAVRLHGKYDADGNPVYVLKTTPAISVVSVPDKLRKKD